MLSSSIPSIKIKPPPSIFSLKHSTIIKCSKADGPLRRPSAPSLSPPPSPPLSPPPTTNTPVASPTRSPLKKSAESDVTGVTLEYQRKVAKELQDYFKKKKLEEAADRGPFFGFIAKNEIGNGRQFSLLMFYFLVNLDV